MAKKRDKREIRAYADQELAKLLATIASLQDISLSQLINDALEMYLQQEKIQALIQKHSLDEINGEEE
jgi:predicted HicB family RNase H-like nuclease